MIYLSGPMSHYPDSNFPAFAAKAQALRVQGITVVSPHELCQPSCDALPQKTNMASIHGVLLFIDGIPALRNYKLACSSPV